jgi:hypothetical protein
LDGSAAARAAVDGGAGPPAWSGAVIDCYGSETVGDEGSGAVAYQATRGISAPPEVVFSTATDPDRLARWLPEPLRARAGEHRLSVLADRMRVEWRPAADDGWSGFLQVEQLPAGGSLVEVTTESTGSAGGADDDVIKLLDGALTELDREVVDNLTAG